MVDSPGRREMEGTNDCTVGRGQRPDIAHIRLSQNLMYHTFNRLWGDKICTFVQQIVLHWLVVLFWCRYLILLSK